MLLLFTLVLSLLCVSEVHGQESPSATGQQLKVIAALHRSSVGQ